MVIRHQLLKVEITIPTNLLNFIHKLSFFSPYKIVTITALLKKIDAKVRHNT